MVITDLNIETMANLAHNIELNRALYPEGTEVNEVIFDVQGCLLFSSSMTELPQFMRSLVPRRKHAASRVTTSRNSQLYNRAAATERWMCAQGVVLRMEKKGATLSSEDVARSNANVPQLASAPAVPHSIFRRDYLWYIGRRCLSQRRVARCAQYANVAA